MEKIYDVLSYLLWTESYSQEFQHNTGKSKETDNEIILVPSVLAREAKKSNLENTDPSNKKSSRNVKEKQEVLSISDQEMPPPASKHATKRKSLSNPPSADKLGKTFTSSKKSSVNAIQSVSDFDTPPRNMLKSSKSTPKLCKKQEGNSKFSSPSCGSPDLRTSPSPVRIKKNAKGETPLHVAVIKVSLYSWSFYITLA